MVWWKQEGLRTAKDLDEDKPLCKVCERIYAVLNGKAR
jgi:hypothetical protein